MARPPTPNSIERLELVLDETRVREGRSEVHTRRGTLRLRGFQEDILEALRAGVEEGRSRLIIVSAPTGAGKTIVPLLPLIDYLLDPDRAFARYSLYEPWSSAAVYPSRELLDDQYNNLKRLLDMIGSRVEPGSTGSCLIQKLAEKGVLTLYDVEGALAALVRVHGETTETIRDAYNECRGVEGPGKLEALLGLTEELGELVKGRGKPGFYVWLTTLEYLALLQEGLYGDPARLGSIVARIAEEAGSASRLAELFDRVSRLSWHDLAALAPSRHRDAAAQKRLLQLIYHGLVFVDEAHLYEGPTRPILVVLLALLLAGSPDYTQLVLSSATHSRGLAEAIEKAVELLAGSKAKRIIELGDEGGQVVRKKTRVILLGIHPPRPLNRLAQVYYAQTQLPSVLLLDEVRSEIRRALDEDRVVLVLGDRLYWLRQAARIIYEEYGVRPVCIDSLSRRGIRPDYCLAPGEGDMQVIVGSSAVSYGIDIPSADVAVIYGKTPSDIIQRLGRTGRRPGGGDAVVFVVTGKKIVEDLQERAPSIRTLKTLREALEDAMGRLPRDAPGTRHLWTAKAAVVAGSTILSMVHAFQEEARRLLSHWDMEKLAKAIIESVGAEDGKVEHRALRIIHGLRGLEESLLPGFAMPRLIVSLPTPYGVVPLHQFLRLCPCRALEGREACREEDMDRYEIALEVDGETYQSLLMMLSDRPTTLQYLASLVAGAGRARRLSARRRRRSARLLQLSADPRGGYDTCRFEMLARLLARQIVVLVDYSSWAEREAGAYTLLTYYTVPSIPVVPPASEAANVLTFAEQVSETGMGAIVFLGGW